MIARAFRKVRDKLKDATQHLGKTSEIDPGIPASSPLPPWADPALLNNPNYKAPESSVLRGWDPQRPSFGKYRGDVRRASYRPPNVWDDDRWGGDDGE